MIYYILKNYLLKQSSNFNLYRNKQDVTNK